MSIRNKSEEEWRKELSPEQYQVLREKGTERPFTGEYWDTKDPGTYHCVVCDAPLYRSEAKYDSGTGWPSFWEPVSDDAAATAAGADAHSGPISVANPRPYRWLKKPAI